MIDFVGKGKELRLERRKYNIEHMELEINIKVLSTAICGALWDDDGHISLSTFQEFLKEKRMKKERESSPHCQGSFLGPHIHL